ncbi:phosphotransferase family protein [Streptomyces sp. NPDC051561]|uniref:phosphotransferase family protein n=1 Tax=Streptomyces sp. NPDC051561 TaxID=3365658 RepID=UPI0037A24D8B
MIELPDQVQTLLRGATREPCRVVADLSWHGPLRNRVWEVESGPPGMGFRRVVKQHVTTSTFQREYAAYKRIVPALGIDRAPLLASAHENTRTLILTRVPGVPVSALSLTAAEEIEVYHQAGEVLALLHAQPAPAPTPGSVTWHDKLTQVQAELLALPEASADLLAMLLSDGPPPKLPRVAVHGDWMPRNWLWDGRHLRVVDFEAAVGAPAACTDLARLGYRVLRGRPDLDTAFRAGYGRNFTRTEHRVMRQCAALDALQALQWGRLHSDKETVAQAHTMISHLRADQDTPSTAQRPGTRRHEHKPPADTRACERLADFVLTRQNNRPQEPQRPSVSPRGEFS